VIPLDDAFDGKELTRVGSAPVALSPGDRVDLYTRNGKVVFYTAAATATPGVVPQALRTDAPADLARRLGELEAEHREAIARRDADIAALRKELTALRAEIQNTPPRPPRAPRGTAK
jgi:hypothetical protein